MAAIWFAVNRSVSMNMAWLGGIFGMLRSQSRPVTNGCPEEKEATARRRTV
jgi:hypothetical protein